MSLRSALARVVYDALLIMDSNFTLALLLLDLCLAFDTIDHFIVLDKLENQLGAVAMHSHGGSLPL